MVGEVGHADHDEAAGVIAGVESLAPRRHDAHRVNGHVHAEAVGELADLGHDLGLVALTGQVLGVDGVGGAELARGLQLGIVDVDGDDLRRAAQLRAGNGGGCLLYTSDAADE